mmetsp:Transcript_19266/g.41776  ORF Transcript_19266/g.41776 Transcript_19266/m.41776 type:complete len:897 (-) Transcript_19266:1846-4536(-)|eukprot:CAMPEP_0172325612 /NCGR_PEP_ID=MMETSP1058-20130122/54456_1 /TAXON_ID=83371 /ORGANISM="Detonula confervacea, Strain CCMP 353" /LENGTH=896 /DNA_ID=CAMNT_0013042203 /DNA_START=52 /DNA_END=2742 /DNA_ORIENTATION=+
MASNYEVGRFLGKGSFASVHLARDIRTRQHCAIKLVDVQEATRGSNDDADAVDEPSAIIMALLQREIDVHTSVSSSRHPNVVTLLESFGYVNQITGSVMRALVLEHCSLGDLQGYMKRVRDQRKLQRTSHQRMKMRYGERGLLLPEGTFLSANEIRHALSQVLCGLSFLHSRGICHRDIKAPNVFLCPIQTSNERTPKKDKLMTFSLLDCQLKLGDFGLAFQMCDDDDWHEGCSTFCGTIPCLAPEVVSRNRLDSSSASRIPNGKTCNKKAEFDSLLGIDTSLLPQQSELEKHAGYGQPADLWSTGCLLYTMIAGRNPFAVAAIHCPTQNQDPKTQTMEKSKRIQQIIERVLRGDWSIPANVRMTKPMEMILHQLLEREPRRRGTARVLNMHPFFQTNSTASASPTMSMVNNEKNDLLNDEHVINNQNDCKSRPINCFDHEQSSTKAHKYQNVDSITTPTAPKTMAYEKNSGQNKENLLDSDNQNVNEMSQSIKSITKYQQAAAEKRPQNDPLHHLPQTNNKWEKLHQNGNASSNSTLDSMSSASSSMTAMANEKNGVQNKESMMSDRRDLQELSQGIKNVNNYQKAALEKRSQNDPFISMKSLHRLPQRKYKWEEPQQNNDTAISKTLFFLGNEGVIIQKEMGSSGLWMHVTSDGSGVLWGKLKPQSSCSAQHESTDTSTTKNDERQLLREAYSRAPAEFSKRALSSLLSLKCQDIISLYESLEHVVQLVKSYTPKITVHLYTTNNNTLQESLFAKTMVMENGPLADIETSFVDGTTIRLSSSDGKITVKGEHGTSQLDIDQKHFFSALKADRSSSPSRNGMIPQLLPPLHTFVHYLCMFIESARECLLLEQRLDSRHLGCQKMNHDAYPSVRKVITHDWHRDGWVVIDDTSPWC